MCYIMLNEKIRINCSDRRMYIPEVLKSNKNQAKDYWKGYGHFTSLKSAVNRIIELEMFKEDAAINLKQFIANFNKVKDELINSTCEKVTRSLEKAVEEQEEE